MTMMNGTDVFGSSLVGRINGGVASVTDSEQLTESIRRDTERRLSSDGGKRGFAELDCAGVKFVWSIDKIIERIGLKC